MGFKPVLFEEVVASNSLGKGISRKSSKVNDIIRQSSVLVSQFGAASGSTTIASYAELQHTLLKDRPLWRL